MTAEDSSLLGSEDGLGLGLGKPCMGHPHSSFPMEMKEGAAGWCSFLWAQSLFLLAWPKSGLWIRGLENQSTENWAEGTATQLMEGHLQGKECKWTQCQPCLSSIHERESQWNLFPWPRYPGSTRLSIRGRFLFALSQYLGIIPVLTSPQFHPAFCSYAFEKSLRDD